MGIGQQREQDAQELGMWGGMERQRMENSGKKEKKGGKGREEKSK